MDGFNKFGIFRFSRGFRPSGCHRNAAGSVASSVFLTLPDVSKVTSAGMCFFPLILGTFRVGVFIRINININIKQISLNLESSRLSISVNEQRLWVNKEIKKRSSFDTYITVYTVRNAPSYYGDWHYSGYNHQNQNGSDSMTVWEIYKSNPCVSSSPDYIFKSHEIYPLAHVWPPSYCRQLFQTVSQMIMSCVCRTSWLKMSTSASPLSRKRRECHRNTGRNEQLQLKTVPKINGHIFRPIWDVTNCSQRA